MTVDACLMVRDEEENIARCLESLRGVVDNVHVMDTGSKDRTMEICRKFGVDLWENPWREDFSWARNQSLTRGDSEWVLVIDADEEICGDAENIRGIANQAPAEYHAISVQVRDMVWRNLKEGEDPYVRVRMNQSRLFRRGKVEYVALVHNSPIFEGQALPMPGAYIKHYGYDLDEEGRERKWWRTMHLLNKRHKLNPYDFPVWFHFAQMYSQKGEWEKTIYWGKRYIEKGRAVSDFNPSVYYVTLRAMMAMGHFEDAHELLQRALKHVPYCVDLARTMMDLGIQLQKPNEVAEGARRFIVAYDAGERNPALMSGRFTYNHNEETLAMALFRYCLISLSDGRRFLERLMGMLDHETLPVEFRKTLQADLDRETEAIGMKVTIVEKERGADDGISNRQVSEDEVRGSYR